MECESVEKETVESKCPPLQWYHLRRKNDWLGVGPADAANVAERGQVQTGFTETGQDREKGQRERTSRQDRDRDRTGLLST